MRNWLNAIAVVQLAPNLQSGELVASLTDPEFRVPITVAIHSNPIYAVNGRFGTQATPTIDYDVEKVDGEDAP